MLVREPANFRDFFKILSHRTPSRYFEPGGLNRLASLVAEELPSVTLGIGEPRALAVYGSISGILQKLPVAGVFQPEQVYVAALFYIAWELVGSFELEGPEIMHAAPLPDVMKAVYEILGWMAAM
jgi:hypothetical protein